MSKRPPLSIVCETTMARLGRDSRRVVAALSQLSHRPDMTTVHILADNFSPAFNAHINNFKGRPRYKIMYVVIF